MVLAIYGAGGSGREAYQMARNSTADYQKIVFIDDGRDVGEFYSCEIMPYDHFKTRFTPDDAAIVIAIGEPKIREKLANKVRKDGFRLQTVIHKNATVSPTAKIGEGVVIQCGCFISENAVIKDNVWVQVGAIIGHDAVIKENCQISSTVVVAGAAVVGENTYVGIGAMIREGISIGNDSIVSMGAIVMKPVRPQMVVMGNPAREIAANDSGKVFKPHND